MIEFLESIEFLITSYSFLFIAVLVILLSIKLSGCIKNTNKIGIYGLGFSLLALFACEIAICALNIKGIKSDFTPWLRAGSHFFGNSICVYCGNILVYWLKEKEKWILRNKILYIFIPLTIGAVELSSPITGLCFYYTSDMVYHTNWFSYIVIGYCFLLTVYSISISVRKGKKLGSHMYYPLLLLSLIPMLIGLRDVLKNIPAFICITSIVYGLLISTISFQLTKSFDLENKLIKAQNSAMVAQIQPHFIYNILSTIQEECYDKAPKAEMITNKFAAFLRQNLTALTVGEPILFTQELRQLKNYLELEIIRFGEKLKVEYNIECESFKIPAISLQPLVGNALKHGIMKRREGGCICISTYQDDNFYYVSIKDDGVGFDVSAPIADDGRSHIGISNTRERIKSMCNGDLIVESEINVGTKITIKIPK